MKIYGQIEQACLEQLASDPSASTAGRIWQNTTSGQVKVDDGVVKAALLRNDEHAIIGSNVTAANNVRLHRAAAALLQLVKASDAAVDGALGTLLAEFSARIENYTSGTKPTNGQIGRIIYLTDTKTYAMDDGSNWINVISQSLATAKGDILARSSTLLAALPVGTNNQVLTADSAQTLGMKWASPAVRPTITNTTGSYTAAIGDGLRLLDASGGTITITLPSAVSHDGETLRYMKTDTTFTVCTLTGVTTLNSQGEMVEITSDGTNWLRTDRSIPSIWQSATFGFSGGVTAVGTQNSFVRREGPELICRLDWQGITAAAAITRIGLPSSLAIDTTKVSNKRSMLGVYTAHRLTNLYINNAGAGAQGVTGFISVDTGLTTSVYMSFQASAGNDYATFTMNSFITNGDGISAEFRVPISGWAV